MVEDLDDDLGFGDRGDQGALSATSVADAIDKLLVDPHMFGAELLAPGSPPAADAAIRAKRENRATLERLFPDSLAGNPLA